MISKTLMTVEEFAELATSETEDFELSDGELIQMSSGNLVYADVRGIMESLLRDYFRQHRLGRAFSEVDCRLSEGTVRRPDVSVFLGERICTADFRKIPVPFAPDIAVEVLSASESAFDVNRKTLQYLAAGSQEVWLIDYENGEIFIQTNDGIRLLRGEAALETPLLPGFSAALSTLLVAS